MTPATRRTLSLAAYGTVTGAGLTLLVYWSLHLTGVL